MLKSLHLRNLHKKRKRQTNEEEENNFLPHYVTFFIHGDMNYDADKYQVQQRGPFLFSSLNKAKLFVLKTIVKTLVGHFQFDDPEAAFDTEHVLHARNEIRNAHEKQFYHTGLLHECKVLVDFFYAKENGDVGIVWQLNVLPQIDVYNEIDLL